MPEATEGARTLDRGLAVLEAVVGGAARLEDVAERTGLSRSAVHRLLTTLTQRGYLQQVAGEGWRAGFGLIELAGQAEQHLDPARVLQEAIEDLAVQVQDSVHVGVLQGSQVVYVAKAQGARTLQLISHVGLRLPAQNTALGRALYAADVEGAVATFDPTLTQTPRSVRTAEEFARVLTETRERGYGIDDEESTLGLTCVAVALPAPDGARPVAAVSVSTPTVYMDDQRLTDLVDLLTRSAPAIGRRFAAARRAGLTI
jgi:IclR family acetate operon transcriptional repressor